MRRRNLFAHSLVRLPVSRIFPVLLLVALILPAPLVLPSALAQDAVPPPPPDNVRAVRLSDVEGQVQVYQDGDLAFDQAQPNMPAVQGMRFVTGDNGRLEIEFEDGSVARVAPNSSIRLAQLQRNADGATVTRIDALTGLSYYELNGRDGQVSVRVGLLTATPEGNSVFRIDLDQVPSSLAVMQGEVHMDTGAGAAPDVLTNETFQVDPQQPTTFNLLPSIAENSWDQWNSDRDQDLAELESSETPARAGTGNPDDAAWSDLDYYGSWYNVPGYGNVWSPNGVGAGWDPFGNGYWGYYPSLGYTWISGYPWGWWPYHCGAWDFLDGWGWIWVPGNCGWGLEGPGWYPYAAVWRTPLGYKPPMRPRRPVSGPVPRGLIAVDRGPQFAAPFSFAPGARPQPRALSFNGTTIPPIAPGIHPAQRGPLGEPFSTTITRVHPELAPSGLPIRATPRPAYLPNPGDGRPSPPAPSRPATTPVPRAPSPHPAPAPQAHPAPAAPHPSASQPHR